MSDWRPTLPGTFDDFSDPALRRSPPRRGPTGAALFSADPSPPSTTTKKHGGTLCKYFANGGRCKYGPACHYAHVAETPIFPTRTTTTASVTAATQPPHRYETSHRYETRRDPSPRRHGPSTGGGGRSAGGGGATASFDAERLARINVWYETDTVVATRGGGKYHGFPSITEIQKYVRLHTADEEVVATGGVNHRRGVASHPSSLQTTITTTSSSSGHNPTVIRICNQDCIEAAADFARDGLRPILMDAGSRNHFGGGFKTGARAQEEELCRRSALANVMVPQEKYYYPLSPSSGIYVPPIPFFRYGPERNYEFFHTSYDIAVGIVAAFNRPELDPWESSYLPAGIPEYRLKPDIAAVTRKMIRTFFSMAHAHGHRSVVCVPLGCGAFRNPALHVAEIFMEELASPENSFYGYFKEVRFAVLDDHNAYHKYNPLGNFPAFGLKALEWKDKMKVFVHREGPKGVEAGGDKFLRPTDLTAMAANAMKQFGGGVGGRSPLRGSSPPRELRGPLLPGESRGPSHM